MTGAGTRPPGRSATGRAQGPGRRSGTRAATWALAAALLSLWALPAAAAAHDRKGPVVISIVRLHPDLARVLGLGSGDLPDRIRVPLVTAADACGVNASILANIAEDDGPVCAAAHLTEALRRALQPSGGNGGNGGSTAGAGSREAANVNGAAPRAAGARQPRQDQTGQGQSNHGKGQTGQGHGQTGQGQGQTGKENGQGQGQGQGRATAPGQGQPRERASEDAERERPKAGGAREQQGGRAVGAGTGQARDQGHEPQARTRNDAGLADGGPRREGQGPGVGRASQRPRTRGGWRARRGSPRSPIWPTATTGTAADRARPLTAAAAPLRAAAWAA